MFPRTPWGAALPWGDGRRPSPYSVPRSASRAPPPAAPPSARPRLGRSLHLQVPRARRSRPRGSVLLPRPRIAAFRHLSPARRCRRRRKTCLPQLPGRLPGNAGGGPCAPGFRARPRFLLRRCAPLFSGASLPVLTFLLPNWLSFSTERPLQELPVPSEAILKIL